MDQRFRNLAARAADHHGVVSLAACQRLGIDSGLLHSWCASGRIERLGPRSFTVAGTPPTWRRALAAGLADLAGHGVLDGRSAGQLLGLDGFTTDAVEFIVPRAHRDVRTSGVVVSATDPPQRVEVITIDGLRCVRADRLIVDSPRFGFSAAETENAIDSAIRLRLVSEQRLRTKVVAAHSRGINGSRTLLDALVDTGGQSRLERWFLRLARSAGLPRPELQRVYRDGSRIVARVDAYFPGNLVVEVEGHGTHSSRRQRQHDEQRRTELTLRGIRVLTFTYLDVRDRPMWVVARLREALAMAA